MLLNTLDTRYFIAWFFSHGSFWEPARIISQPTSLPRGVTAVYQGQ